MTALAGDTPLSSAPEARKTVLRRELRARRIAVPKAQRRHAAETAAIRLLKLLRKARRVAVYLSARSELSTAPLIQVLLDRRIKVYVPMVLREHRMAFVPLTGRTRLRRNALGLPQPVSIRGRRSVGSFDHIVMPLLGFDADGRRLGNGGGFYDRALYRDRIVRRPLLIGYAFAVQQVAELPEEPWDVPLDWLVTERGILRF